MFILDWFTRLPFKAHWLAMLRTSWSPRLSWDCPQVILSAVPYWNHPGIWLLACKGLHAALQLILSLEPSAIFTLVMNLK